MSEVARGKNRWIEATSDVQPPIGSLVVYDDGLYHTTWCFWDCKPGQNGPIAEKVVGSQVNQATKIGSHCEVSIFVHQECHDEYRYSRTSILNLLNSSSVVYMGKIGSAGCNDSDGNYRLPFGCGVVATLYKNGVEKWSATKVSAMTDTVVYKRAPLSSVGYINIANCVVKRLKSGDEITITGVVGVTTKKEQTAFWGTVDSVGEKCLGQ